MNADAFFARLCAHPRRDPALLGRRGPLAYSTLLDSVDALAGQLARQQTRRLATLLPNGPAWVIADLAALRAGIVHVPLPTFFAASQIEFALAAAGADTLLAEEPPVGWRRQERRIAGASLYLAQRDTAPTDIPSGTRKITFTSGSTGTPKAVCLDAEAQLTVAAGLAQALAPLAVRWHLCSLPLAVLLENVAGIYAPLIAGAAVVVPSAAETGLDGASSFSPAALNAAVVRHGADSVITLPQTLRAWSAWRQQTAAAPLPTLKFVAVGGAQVGKALIAQARRAGLPAFEGYGLSEGASVQALNLPHADRPGSAGKPLPHAQVRIADDGEVWVAGSPMLGYLGEPRRRARQWLATGDLGRLDAEGFLHLRGRKSNLLITAFGRNVSPEWVETTLQAQDEIAQAVVFGEAQPALSAVLWPMRPSSTEIELDAAVAAANAALPDYARIAHWVRAAHRFDAASGMATANGRPRRDAIAAAHAVALHTAFDITHPRITESHAIL
jgi:long-subunit acyl-CoA synthetase (AMP-forming)